MAASQPFTSQSFVGKPLIEQSYHSRFYRPHGGLIAAEIVNDAERLAGPVESARVLPPLAYVDPDLWNLECQEIFAREWVYVGHVSQVATPSTVLPTTVAGEPVLLTRDESGAVRVLSSLCQHRAHPLLDGLGLPPGGGCVETRRVTCPYHGWTYGLDGALLAAPFMNETTPIAQLRRSIRLPELRTEIFHGFVFATLDPASGSLLPTLTKFDRLLNGYSAEDLVASAPVIRRDLPYNWKSAFENALEPYHTDYVHRGSHDAAPSSGSGFYPFEAGDGQIVTYTAFAEGASELFSGDGSTMLPEFRGINSVQRSRLLFVAIPPTFFAVISPSSILVNAISSDGPERTGIDSVLFHPPEATAVEGFDKLRQAELDALEVIQDQDAATQSAVQRGLRSRFAPRGPLSWLEATLPQFNAWLLPRYRRIVEISE